MKELSSEIMDELLQRAEAEQALRQQWDDNDTEEFRLQVLARDNDNTAFLKELVETSGWPTISEVGKEVAMASWLIAQHTPEKTFLRHCLELMLESPDEVEPQNLARTIDRVRIYGGHKQWFGTHFTKSEDGSFAPMPIEDAEHVDERRARWGLPSIEEKTKEYNQG